jgi:hypothetical protein
VLLVLSWLIAYNGKSPWMDKSDWTFFAGLFLRVIVHLLVAGWSGVGEGAIRQRCGPHAHVCICTHGKHAQPLSPTASDVAFDCSLTALCQASMALSSEWRLGRW